MVRDDLLPVLQHRLAVYRRTLDQWEAIEAAAGREIRNCPSGLWELAQADLEAAERAVRRAREVYRAEIIKLAVECG